MMTMRLLTLGLAVLLTWSATGQTIYKGIATRVYDGDTFTLQRAGNDDIKIRIVGIDAPEKDQAFGIQSRDYARQLLDGKKVTVYTEPGETYGRKLGIVITEDGKHFNYEMVANGYAWWYDQYSKDKYLEAAQLEAKRKKLGLWNNPNAQAPWEYRRRNN